MLDKNLNPPTMLGRIEECEMDWTFVSEELRKIHLYEFAAVVFAFIKRWFDISVPFDIRDLSEEFYIKSTQKIFEDGVFGFDNEENKNSEVALQMHYRGINRRDAKRTFILKSLFPKYETMSRLPYCSYVKQSKILLPAAWIHRFFYRGFNKNSRDRMIQQLSSENVNERMDLLREWGL